MEWFERGIAITGVPTSHSGTVGFFAEEVYPYNQCLTLKAGARADIVTSDIDNRASPTDCATLASVLGTDRFERTVGLFLGYGTAEYKLNPEWTLTGGMATFSLGLRNSICSNKASPVCGGDGPHHSMRYGQLVFGSR